MPEILVVDNHPGARFLSQLLAGRTHRAWPRTLAALDLLERIRPQVIFVDLLMPTRVASAACCAAAPSTARPTWW
jgi:CheY-like chemotaxis protein